MSGVLRAQHRRAGMEKLKGLDFSTPNNACLSLQILAEFVRRQEILIVEESRAPDRCEPVSAGLIIGFAEKG